MLPHSYESSAAVVLVLGGFLACFAGYRLFRLVLGIYGFIAGAMLASSVMGSSNTVGMLLAALIGGLLGALILVFAYFVGIAIVGAGIGVFLLHAVWARVSAMDPPIAVVIGCALLGTIVAMILQRYVIVVGTAFGGAWTIIVGAAAVASDRVAPRGASAAEAWIFYPASPLNSPRWILLAWVGLGLLGTAVQLGLTGRRRR
jgi:hypothetical protein